ncbi:MAG: NAD(P)H-hydrate dehydratase [Acaryochloridaceae cyanobacterium CSU_3_4]|nr:NAD(P)H-hydrate dehydratase [Acaryochloridaceae cyanobacterium CSU_3_4]
MKTRQADIHRVVVTAEQMREIESRIFAAGMPVAALMEKVGGLIAHRIQTLYSCLDTPSVGILIGPGHNGGDALVVARELHFQGYQVQICRPLPRAKALTDQHAQYVASLGLPISAQLEDLHTCDLLIDGLFGFGLERPLEGAIANLINQINTWSQPLISIDLPSGLHTDTGEVLGTAIQATHTLCLGLWKLGLLQDQGLAYIGKAQLIDFGIPLADITAVLGSDPAIQRITPAIALAGFPLPRHPKTHKYRQGHCLLIGGSQEYGGSIILTALGCRATGVGMVTIAVPAFLKPLLLQYVPEALVVACPETHMGAIAHLPKDLSLEKFDAIVYGPGVTTTPSTVLESVLPCPCPLILDADGLTLLADQDPVAMLKTRPSKTILTPHPGEFKRLFPLLNRDNVPEIVQQAAQATGAYLVYKGARVILAPPQGSTWINPESTPALARGGSGDVLAGILGGLVAQSSPEERSLSTCLCSGIWWHAQAGRRAADNRTELGVDPLTLCDALIPTLTLAADFQT